MSSYSAGSRAAADPSAELRRQLRAVRAEMRAKGIRRISCFNGGLTGETYRLNALVFTLETRLKGSRL